METRIRRFAGRRPRILLRERKPSLRGDKTSMNRVLADDYTGVYFHISFWEAAGRRLRRNYCWIFGIQVVSYWGKLLIHPTAAGENRLGAKDHDGREFIKEMLEQKEDAKK